MPSPPEECFDLFVSYAHVDDVDGWVGQLIEALLLTRARRDYRPWVPFFDRRAIRPGHDWEGRLAKVRTAGALLVLLSPAYLTSDWCFREWQAFREQELATRQDLRLFLVYLQTDPDFERYDPARPPASDRERWYADLKRRQYIDLRPWFSGGPWWRRLWCRWAGPPTRPHALWERTEVREQLEQLERAVHDRLSDLGHARRALGRGIPYLSPSRPDHFVPRPQEIDRLRELVLSPEGKMTALFGLGGVGKSTLAAALTEEPAVRRHFDGGILWATLGEHPEIQSLLTGWIRALGDHEFRGGDVTSAREHLRGLLQDRRTLLVVDDAWTAEAVEPFRVGGPDCHLLLTTRDAGLAEDLGARLLPLDVMTAEQALVLLAGRLGRALPPEELPEARDLTEAVGRLPLAVELVAAQAADGVPLKELLAELRAETARLEALDRPGADEAATEVLRKRRSLRASVSLSLARLKPERRERFAWLGVTPDDAVLNPRMAAMLWQLEERRAREELLLLAKKALLQPTTPVRVDGQLVCRSGISPSNSPATLPGV